MTAGGDRAGTVIRAAAGIIVSLVALAIVVGSVDLSATETALRGTDARWLALLGGLIALDVALRVVRWRTLLAPVARVDHGVVAGALLIGYLANNVLPARLGELVRAHVLGDRTGIARSTVLGTVVVERVVDTAVVVAIAAAAILVLSVRGIVASAVLVGLALTALLALAVGAAILAHRLPGASRLSAFAHRRPAVHAILARLRAGLAVAGHPRSMAGAILLSIGSWSFTVLAFAAAAQAVGIEPTMGQAALLAAGTNLATAIPSAPGYVGTFELAVVTIAASVGIPAGPALAFGILVHVATLALTSVGGALALAMSGRRPRA